MRIVILVFFLFITANSNANSSESVTEEIIIVKTTTGYQQQGVLSKTKEITAPKKLIVLVSGSPSVTRPRVDENGKITTRQNGNFLVRSRHYLLSAQVITLLLDCRSDFDSACPDDYQASLERGMGRFN